MNTLAVYQYIFPSVIDVYSQSPERIKRAHRVFSFEKIPYDAFPFCQGRAYYCPVGYRFIRSWRKLAFKMFCLIEFNPVQCLPSVSGLFWKSL